MEISGSSATRARIDRRRLVRASLGALPAALAVAALALLRAPTLAEPMWYGDEGIFAAIAANFRDGRMLYAEAWDNKPPLIFLTYAGVQAVFGESVAALHAVTSAAAAATQLALIVIAWRLYGAWRAAAAGAVFAALFGLPVIEGNLALTETYMVLPSTLGVLAATSAAGRAPNERVARYAIAGALFGLASLYKQVAVLDAAAVATFIWLAEARRSAGAGALAAGFALPHMPFVAWFALTGALDEYVYAVAGSLGLYSSLSEATPLLVRVATVVPLLLAAVYALDRRAQGSLAWRHFAPLWLGFAFAGAAASTFAFPHYLLQAAPPFALTLASLRWPRSLDIVRMLPAATAATAALVALAIFGPTLDERQQLDPVRYYRGFVEHHWGTMPDHEYELRFDGKVQTVDDITGLIERDARGDTLFQWGEFPWLYVASDTLNPSRYYTSFLGEFVPDAKTEIMDELEASPPAYVVVSDNAVAPFPELERFIERERYDLIDARNDWRLYGLPRRTR
ncbi:MAG TPA: hypothetical protein VNM91_07995 [Dehalococcoidia bacterium]|nr:hypothetical protein [Dehalococcoidia bacterium]